MQPGPLPWSPAHEPRFSAVTTFCSTLVHCTGPISVSPALPRCSRPTTAMVRTRGGSRLWPRVRFNTPEREEQAPVPAPVPDPVPAPVPEAVSEEPQGFRRYQTRMGPRAPSLVPQRRSRGPGLPSGPAHQVWVSHPHPGLSRRQPHQQQRRHLHHSYRLPPGSGGRCLSGTPFWGTSHFTRETSMGSHITTSRC